MKDAPYAFWCSRCKIDHPGECATTAQLPAVLTGFASQVIVGSKWVQEDFNPISHIWTKGRAGYSWTISELPTDKDDRITIMAGSGATITVPSSAFTEDGVGHYKKWRLVPAS